MSVHDHPTRNSAINRREIVLLWSAAALLWVALWRAGLPAPHVDDLFFAGTGVALAQGLGLHNPWIEPWLAQFGSTFFYAQPPVQPFALASWIRIWGVSAASILGFQCVAGWICTGGAVHLLRKVGAPHWSAALGAGLMTIFVLARGLRPDAWGAAMALLAALAWLHEGRRMWATGCLAAALAPALHPFAAIVVIPSACLAFATRTRGSRKAVLLDLGIAAAAILAVLGLVAWMLDFATKDFWRAFHYHALMRTPRSGSRLTTFGATLTLGFEPLIKLPGAAALALALALAWFAGNRRRAIEGLLLCIGALGLGILLYAGNTPNWLWPLAGGVTLGAWASVRSFPRRALVSGLLGLLVIWNHLPWLVSSTFARAVPAREYGEIRNACEQLRPTRLLVDETAARHIFDYRLPAGALDWLLNRRLESGMLGSLAARPAGEVWLVDERKLELLVPDSGVRAARSQLAGISLQSWLIHPGRIHLMK